MFEIELTAAQEAEAGRIEAVLLARCRVEARTPFNMKLGRLRGVGD